MFPLSLLQPSQSHRCIYREPALTLWPATCLVLGQLENDMLSARNEMEKRIHLVNQAVHFISQDMDMARRRTEDKQAVAKDSEKTSQKTENEGKEHFEISLDVSHFSPEELTVKTEGRRLIVMGKHDQKSHGEDGSYFHEVRQWRREAELPENVNPEDMLCSLSQDGKLYLQAPRQALPVSEERSIPINTSHTPLHGGEQPNEHHNSSSKEETTNQMDSS